MCIWISSCNYYQLGTWRKGSFAVEALHSGATLYHLTIVMDENILYVQLLGLP